ncbi:MAG TPA: hypothetical protein PKN48_01660 [Bacteroidales bacterium]|nr:hypothetical protein [Bacteroidales bacterium]
MKKLILIIAFICFGAFVSGCDDSNCDNCTIQKREFCLMMFEAGCNSAALTTNIDYLIQACGQDEANSWISAVTDSCTQGILVCPEECK